MAGEQRPPIGALWEKRSMNGTPYLSGEIELKDGTKLQVVAFKNGYKQLDKHPDWRVFEQEKFGDGYSRRIAPGRSSAGEPLKTPPPPPPVDDGPTGFEYPEEEINPEDIPF